MRKKPFIHSLPKPIPLILWSALRKGNKRYQICIVNGQPRLEISLLWTKKRRQDENEVAINRLLDSIHYEVHHAYDWVKQFLMHASDTGVFLTPELLEQVWVMLEYPLGGIAMVWQPIFMHYPQGVPDLDAIRFIADCRLVIEEALHRVPPIERVHTLYKIRQDLLMVPRVENIVKDKILDILQIYMELDQFDRMCSESSNPWLQMFPKPFQQGWFWVSDGQHLQNSMGAFYAETTHFPYMSHMLKSLNFSMRTLYEPLTPKWYAELQDEVVTDRVKRIIFQYHSDIEQAKAYSADELRYSQVVLVAIARSCLQLARAYVGDEIKTRRVLNIILNKMLLQHHMPPTVLYAVHALPGSHIDDVTAEIRRGWATYFELTEQLV